ncbi:MAG: hypothetical protein L6Q72_17005, partial [Burkholderiaceae bacterium]|nr:hypothetical protein [Burkholderiaceae bacterium]
MYWLEHKLLFLLTAGAMAWIVLRCLCADRRCCASNLGGKQMIRKLASLACVLMLAAAPTAHASLLGQTADCDMQPNGSFWSCSPASNTVTDPGIEFQLNLVGNPFFSIDIGASSVLLTLISGGGLGMGAGEVLTLSGLDGILGA